MTTEYTGNAIPAASVTDGPSSTDPEVLYSTSGWTQKGITLEAGNGIIPAGCVMGQVTATKLWKVYSNAASDGTEVARGILRQGVDTGTDASGATFAGNLIIRGILKSAQISGSDANALTDLGARTDSVLGTFTL